MSKASIIGAYNTQFGSFTRKDRETGEVADLKSIYELIVEAGQGALADAGVDHGEIDGIWLGSCSPSLFANQEHLAPWGVEVDPEAFRFLPSSRVENACATSTTAIHNAIYAVESGRFDTVLVIGVEKMTLLNTKGVTHALACSSHWESEGARGMTFPGLFAEYAKGYQAQYGLSDDAFARMRATMAALMYRNGIENPLAHFGKGGPSDRMELFSADAILALPDEKNVMIAPPLRLHDCSLISDGAAAVVITRTDRAKTRTAPAVEIAGIGHSTERLPINVRPNMFELMGAKDAVGKAFREASITTADLDLVEVHDCFTIAGLLCTEALGLSADGRAGYDYLDGRFAADDTCPVNLSGGLKAKGHPVGATGASMHALLYRQLVGQPIGVAPKKQPETAALLNVGGSGVTNAVSVLRRIG